MTRRVRYLPVLAGLTLLAMTPAAAHERATPPSPSAYPTPNPSVQMPTGPMPPVAPPARLGIPQWKQGMSWQIEVDVPDGLNAGTPPWVGGHKRRSGVRPRYSFRIDRVGDAGALRLFSVQVRPVNEEQKTSADLVFAGLRNPDGTLASLFIMKGLYRMPTGTGVSQVRRDYNKEAKAPFPVINNVNGLPTDYPFLSTDELGRHDGKIDGVWKEYTAVEVVEGDKRDRSVRQTILFASDKMQFGEKPKVNAPRKECVDVFMKILSSPGNETTRLTFHPAYPWPVYGEGPKGRFWLLP